MKVAPLTVMLIHLSFDPFILSYHTPLSHVVYSAYKDSLRLCTPLYPHARLIASSVSVKSAVNLAYGCRWVDPQTLLVLSIHVSTK